MPFVIFMCFEVPEPGTGWDSPSIVPRLPNLSNVHEKEVEPGMQCHVRNVGLYTKVGRVADRGNCV